uniref:Transmembrane protein n=1 Tax=Arundo donax TaxID=35708 RepID=A0A0A9CLV3_ARUDO
MMEVPQSVLGTNWIEEILLVQGTNLLVLIILICFLKNQKKISILREPVDIQIPGTSMKTPNLRMSMSDMIFTTIQVNQTKKIAKMAIVVIPLLLPMIGITRQLNFCGGMKLLSLDDTSLVNFLLTAKVIDVSLYLHITQEKNRTGNVWMVEGVLFLKKKNQQITTLVGIVGSMTRKDLAQLP